MNRAVWRGWLGPFCLLVLVSIPVPIPVPFPLHPQGPSRIPAVPGPCPGPARGSRRMASQTTSPVVPRGVAQREAGTALLAVYAGSCSPARLQRGQRGAAGSHYRERGAAAVALPRSAAPPPHGEGPPWRRSLAPARLFFPAAGAEGAAAVRPSAEGGSPASRSGCCPPRAALPGAMSLVAYASSEEDSDAEEPAGEEEEAADSPPAADEQPSSRGLFAALPPPRAPAVPPSFLMGPLPTVSGFGSAPPGQAGAESPPEPAASGDGAAESPRPRGLLLPPPRNAAAPRSPPPAASPGAGLGLPKPKKRTEPVRIAAPELHKGDSDSEEDEPAKKKNTLQGRSEGSGLSALLPQPKNMTVKETNRLLLPYSFSRKAGENSSDSKPSKAPSSSSKPKPVAKPAVATTPSPSAIKAAAKSAALQVTKQITQEEEDSDEEVQPENYFSLSDRSEPAAVGTEPYLYPGTGGSEEPPPGTEPEPQFQDAAANAPLEFRTGVGSSGVQHSWAAKPGEDYGSQPYGQFPPAYSEPGGYYQDYYSSGYYPEVEPAQASPQESSTDSSFIDDEAFKRLQGKRNRGREEINFVDIKGDDQLSGAQQWLTKSLTEEKTMKSFSKKKGDQPTGQQRRKHQITYLIHQAKERELELKNTWSENKLSRRQTQAKYGF